MKKDLTVPILLLMTVWLWPVIGEGAGASFLKIGMGARAASLGEAYTALADDVSAIYWNPAGLSQLERQELDFMHSQWLLDDINYEFVGLSYIIEDTTFAGALNYLYLGNIPETKNSLPHKTGNVFEASDTAIAIAIAQRLEDNLSLGAGFKIIQEQIEKEKASGYAIDLGLLCQPYPDVSFGLSVQNLGSRMKFIKDEFSLPLTYRAGLAVNKGDFTLSTDISKVKDTNNLSFSTGLEVLFGRLMALRFGYKYKKSNTDLGKFRGVPAGLSAGFGINLGQSTQIDYCYAPYGELEDTHRFSVKIKLGPRQEAKRYQPPQELSWRQETEGIQKKGGAVETKVSKKRLLQKKESTITVKVKMNKASIWQGAGSNYPPLTEVDKGTELMVLDTSQKWYYKVMLPDGRIGWVNSTFIEW